MKRKYLKTNLYKGRKVSIYSLLKLRSIKWNWSETEPVLSDEEDDNPIQFQAKQTVTAADIKLRIDAPPSADNAVEVSGLGVSRILSICCLLERGCWAGNLQQQTWLPLLLHLCLCRSRECLEVPLPLLQVSLCQSPLDLWWCLYLTGMVEVRVLRTRRPVEDE